jgi:hypothetical protein
VAVTSEAGYVAGRTYSVYSRSCEVTGVSAEARFTVGFFSAPREAGIAAGLTLGFLALTTLFLLLAAFVRTGSKLKHL